MALGAAGSLQPIVILWLVLKYLPSAAHSISSAFNEYQQGQLARTNRKRIRDEMEEDPDPSRLPKEQRRELARLVNALAEKESGLLPRVNRFMKRSFLGVRIEVVVGDDDGRSGPRNLNNNLRCGRLARGGNRHGKETTIFG